MSARSDADQTPSHSNTVTDSSPSVVPATRKLQLASGITHPDFHAKLNSNLAASHPRATTGLLTRSYKRRAPQLKVASPFKVR